MKSDKWKFFFLVIIQYNVTWNQDVLTSMSADSLRGSEYIGYTTLYECESYSFVGVIWQFIIKVK